MAEALFSDEDNSNPSAGILESGDFSSSDDESAEVSNDSLPNEPHDIEDNESLSLPNSLEDVNRTLSQSFEHLLSSSKEALPAESNNMPDISDGSNSDDESGKKKVRVGNHYQARIPKFSTSSFNDDLYATDDTLLWDPYVINADSVETFLQKVSSLTTNVLPLGVHLRDNEQALYILQQCNHDIDGALKKYGSNQSPDSNFTHLQTWTEEDCKNFEKGFVRYNKDFYKIQDRTLNTRSIKELVQFYYLWKKSERYDVFSARTRAGKKKYLLNPGVPNLTHKYLHLGGIRVHNEKSLSEQVKLVMKNKASDENTVQY